MRWIAIMFRRVSSLFSCFATFKVLKFQKKLFWGRETAERNHTKQKNTEGSALKLFHAKSIDTFGLAMHTPKISIDYSSIIERTLKSIHAYLLHCCYMFLTFVGDHWDTLRSLLRMFQTFVGDHGESSGWLGGAPRVIKGHLWKRKLMIWNICSTFSWSVRDPSKSHFGSFLNICLYLGTSRHDKRREGEGFRSSHRCDVHPLLTTLSDLHSESCVWCRPTWLRTAHWGPEEKFQCGQRQQQCWGWPVPSCCFRSWRFGEIWRSKKKDVLLRMLPKWKPPAPACQGHQGCVIRYSSLFNNYQHAFRYQGSAVKLL